MKITFPYLILFLLATSSCKNDHLGKKESNQVHREVMDMLHNYYLDINRDGLLAELKYLDSTKDFSWHPPGFESPLRYDSAAAIIRNNALVIHSANLTWDSLAVVPLSKDTATYTGHITSIVIDSSGFADTLHLYEEGIVIKRSSGWKLLRGKTDLAASK